MADATKAPGAAELWPLIHERRAAVGAMLSTLSDAQWDQPSLCTGWRVRDVAAHCVDTHLMTPPRFIGKFVASGFHFHAVTAKGVAAHRDQQPQELLAQYRATMNRTTTPPGPKVAMLAEAVIHGEDMARPLGTRVDAAPAALVAAVNFTRSSEPLLHGKSRSAGLRLRASDVDWTAGDGPEVTGPLIAIIMALAGRGAFVSDLTGDGVTVLRTRL